MLIKGDDSSRCENSFDKFRGGENKRRVNMNGRAEFFYSMIIEIWLYLKTKREKICKDRKTEDAREDKWETKQAWKN